MILELLLRRKRVGWLRQDIPRCPGGLVRIFVAAASGVVDRDGVRAGVVAATGIVDRPAVVAASGIVDCAGVAAATGIVDRPAVVVLTLFDVSLSSALSLVPVFVAATNVAVAATSRI